MRKLRSSFMRRTLLGGALLSLAWVTYRLSISPLERRAQELHSECTDVRERIASTRRAIQEIKRQEQAAAGSRGELRRLHHDLPTGSVIVWFPTRMKQYFDRFDLTDSATRLNTAVPEPEIPGFQRTYWSVDLPLASQKLSELLIAIENLEDAEPIVKILDLAIRQDNESGQRTMVINVAALVCQ